MRRDFRPDTIRRHPVASSPNSAYAFAETAKRDIAVSNLERQPLVQPPEAGLAINALAAVMVATHFRGNRELRQQPA